MKQINSMSDYWLGTDVDDKYYDPLTGEYNKPSGKDLLALSGYQRAISNFVRILTNENIPVEFKGDDSYTDGKRVVISGNIKSGNFDVAVGLALHEGSHVKLTNFTHIRNGLDNYIPTELLDKANVKGITKWPLVAMLKSLLNVVEDRRIDKYVQTEAPGYRGYYEAMYDYYFNDAIIDKALQTQQWCAPTSDNYMNHVINFINPNRTLDLLPGLRDMWNILDLKNIQRLKTTDDALNVALKMLDKLIDVLPVTPQQKEPQEQQDQQGSSSSSNNTSKTLIERIDAKINVLQKALQLPSVTPQQSNALLARIEQLENLKK